MSTIPFLPLETAHPVGGVLALASHREIVDRHGADLVVVAEAHFAFPWNGALAQFHKDTPTVVEPGLMAALVEAGAPVVRPNAPSKLFPLIKVIK